MAAAQVLLDLGAHVTVVDDANGGPQQASARQLESLGAAVRLASVDSPDDYDLLIPSPGINPRSPLVVAAQRSRIPVWSGERLAWHLRPTGSTWLTVSGTNGKTTTVEMLNAILTAAGVHCAAVGNIGRPLVEAVTAEPPYDVLAVELSSFQLHFTRGLQPEAAALLNVGVDHIDWHETFDAYVDDKARVFDGARRAVVYNVADPTTERLARNAEVEPGCAGVGFTLGAPAAGMLGVVDGVLVDRAFVTDPAVEAAELATLDDLNLPGSHNVENALAASALARAHGVPADAVRSGLRGFQPAPHRTQLVDTIDGVAYVDDSKATNADAALVSLRTFRPVVWIAGGLAKGGRFDDLVGLTSSRLRGVVLIGRDRGLLRDALRRHAPQVHVIEVVAGETDLMDDVVSAAAGLAVPGDTVLLAPACASMDQFTDYAARGDAFAAAVRRRSDGGS